MTSITVHSSVFYLTNKEVKWRGDDYKAHHIVKSCKDEPWKGYITLRSEGARRLTFADRDVIRRQANLALANKIRENIQQNISIVPVPDSATYVGSDEDGRAARMARELSAAIGPLAEAAIAIRWANPRTPQHGQSGVRRMSHYLSQLVVADLPRWPVVLVDDMITSGSQMLACANLLEAAGCSILFGVVVGKRALEAVDQPLGWDTEVFEQDEQISLFAE